MKPSVCARGHTYSLKESSMLEATHREYIEDLDMNRKLHEDRALCPFGPLEWRLKHDKPSINI